MTESRQKAEARLRSALLWGDEISNLPPITPLVEGILDLDNLSMWYGKWGAGKSLVVHDLICSVVTGQSWWGHRVKTPGKVLYVMGEGATGTAPRYEAWKAYHGRGVGSQLVWLPVAPNLTDEEQRDVLFEIVKEHQPVLTVLDTLARHLPGVEENNSPAMSVMVETLDEIRRLTGGNASVVHHQGKSDDAGARGHSSLPGAMDTVIEVKPQKVDGAHYLQLWVEKQKNHEDGYSLGTWRLQRVELEPGEDGPRYSVVPVSTTIAHPVRLRILDYLREHPGATKRELRTLGDSSTVDRELAGVLADDLVRVEISGTTHHHFIVEKVPSVGRA